MRRNPNLTEYLCQMISKQKYQENIPACCTLKTADQHWEVLGLCWGVTAAIETGECVGCGACEFSATRDSYLNGRHCGHLISRVANPYQSGSDEHVAWEAGFLRGRKDIYEELKNEKSR